MKSIPTGIFADTGPPRLDTKLHAMLGGREGNTSTHIFILSPRVGLRTPWQGKMNQFMRAALLAFIVIVSVSPQGLDRVWSQPTDTAAVIEGAKKEGELVIYGTTDLRQATLLNDKFRQKYP